MRKSEKPVSASEIGRVSLCPKAYALEKSGYKASKYAEKKRSLGNKGHANFNHQRKKDVKRPCFIATQTLGENHMITQSLRDYRDNQLEKSTMGRLFIKCYYGISPLCIPVLKRSERLNKLARGLVVAFYKKWVNTK